MNPATSSLEEIFPQPDDTNALTQNLSSYPVANYNINARVCDTNANDNNDKNSDPRLDLDSHANMVVLGQHFYIIYSSGRHTEVNAFTR